MRKLLTMIAFTAVTGAYAQNLDYLRFGIGGQASFPAFGLSAKADITEQHSAQLVVGVAGPFSAYYGRYLYNFPESGNDLLLNPYLYGQAGLYTYKGLGVNYNNFSLYETTEKVFGWGVGGGLQFCFPNLTDRIKFNAELGYGKVGFDYYDFKSITFGAGIHYYFNL
jgi:hypothetical protein